MRGVPLFFIAALSLFSLVGTPTQKKTPSQKKRPPVFIVTPQEFSKITHSPLPVLLDIHADWCHLCQKMKPIFDAAAYTFLQPMRFARIFIESFEDSDPVMQFLKRTYQVSITCVPTFLFIRNGRIIARFEGYMNRALLEQKVTELLDVKRV